jgi:hypothetical protein
MATPRKDVKVYFDAEVHAAIKSICDRKGLGLGEYIESLVVPHIKSVVDDVTVLHAEFLRSGIARNGQESTGKTGERDR